MHAPPGPYRAAASKDPHRPKDMTIATEVLGIAITAPGEPPIARSLEPTPDLDALLSEAPPE